MLMHIITCLNYFDLNKTVALRTGGGGGGERKKIVFFCKFQHTNGPFRLYKIIQCGINQENLSTELELIITIKQTCF